MYSYSIANDILPQCAFVLHQEDAPDGAKYSVQLTLPKTSRQQRRALASFIEDLQKHYPSCRKLPLNGGTCLRVTPDEADPHKAIADMLRFLAARYGYSLDRLIDSCGEHAATVGEYCMDRNITDSLRIEQVPGDERLVVTMNACAQQPAFVSWVKQLYQCEEVTEENGKVTMHLRQRHSDGRPTNEAECMASLTREIQHGWGIDRAQLLRCIQPASARDHAERVLALHPAPQQEALANGAQYSQDIAVVGTGFTGVSFTIQALHDILAHPQEGPIRIRLIERRPSKFAGGIAYGMAGFEHRVNVPAEYLSLDPDNPNDFVDWMKDVQAHPERQSESYMKLSHSLDMPHENIGKEATQRRLYQFYLTHRLHDAVEAAREAGVADVQIVYDEVRDIARDGRHFDVELGKGRKLNVTDVVLATGHGATVAPKFLEDAKKTHTEQVVLNQWDERNRLHHLMKDPNVKNILVFGTSLSAMDVMMTAERLGFFKDPTRTLTLLSRSGEVHPILDTEHPYRQPTAHLSDFGPVPHELQEVEPYVGRAIESLRKKGLSTIGREHTTEEVIFALTTLIPEFIHQSGLPEKELNGLLRKYNTFLNTESVPMAKNIGLTYQRLRDEGRVVVATGDTAAIDSEGSRLRLNFKDGKPPLLCDAAISTLPPTSDPARIPLYNKLMKKGLLCIEPRTGMGIDVDTSNMRAVNVKGNDELNLHVIGPVIVGDAMADFGQIGPLSQIVSGLRVQAKRAAMDVSENRAQVRRPTVALLMNSRPGTSDADICRRWSLALENFGLRVVLVKPGLDLTEVKELLRHVDGTVLGGGDSNVAPSRYGAMAAPGQTFDPARDQTAAHLIRECEQQKIPIFGVCLGAQEMNVAKRGTLNQHLEGHDFGYLHPNQKGKPAHPVTLERGGWFTSLLPGVTTMEVTSIHRQGIARLGEGLQVEAKAGDVVEAFSLPRRLHPFFVGVQFHPEFDSLEPHYRALFEGFATAVRARNKQPRTQDLPLEGIEPQGAHRVNVIEC